MSQEYEVCEYTNNLYHYELIQHQNMNILNWYNWELIRSTTYRDQRSGPRAIYRIWITSYQFDIIFLLFHYNYYSFKIKYHWFKQVFIFVARGHAVKINLMVFPVEDIKALKLSQNWTFGLHENLRIFDLLHRSVYLF